MNRLTHVELNRQRDPKEDVDENGDRSVGNLLSYSLTVARFFLRQIARIFLSPMFPPAARKRLLLALEKNPLARSLVLRLPARVKLDDAFFLTDVGSPTVSSRLGFWTGTHEAPERRLVRNLLPGVPILEVGAGVGVVSHAAWKAAGRPSIIVVEANPLVIETLKANLRDNDVPAQVVHSALAYGHSAELMVDREWITGKVASDNGAGATGIEVPATTLSRLIEDHFHPSTQVQLVLDIEGGEWELLEREAELIKHRVARVVVELHGSEDTAALIERGRQAFGALGFEELDSDGCVVCYANQASSGEAATDM